MMIDSQTGLVDFTPESGQVGDTPIEVLVTDNVSGGQDNQAFLLTIFDGPPNESPTITSFPTGPARIGFEYQYDVEADDPNGDSLFFNLPTAPRGMSVDSVTGLINWTSEADQVGDNEVTVVVIDNRGGRATQQIVLPVVFDADAQNDASCNSFRTHRSGQ